jgi:hypothetical protein
MKLSDLKPTPLQPESNVSTVSTEAIAAKAAGLDYSTMSIRDPRQHVYDPIKRSPIAKPQQEICPHCGQAMPKAQKAVLTHMNQYINENGAMIVVSANDTTLEVKGVKYFQVTSEEYDKEKQEFVYTSKYMPTAEKMS